MNTKVQRALAISILVWILGTVAVYADDPVVHTDCSDYEEAPVGLFVDEACLPSEAWWPVFGPWETSLEGEEIDNSISSIFVKEGWSVFVAENPDGSGNSTCLSETKWEMNGDKWPGTEVQMGNSISQISVHENADCSGDEPPVQEETTYCDDLSLAGVGLFDLAACQQPGMAITSTITGTLNLGQMNDFASSVYVANGWSLWISNGDQEACIFETKWDLSGDKWENGASQDNSITSAVVFSDPNCGAGEQAPPDVQTDCSDYDEAPVGLFVDVACLPAEVWWPVFTPFESSLEGEEIDNALSSISIEAGWSVHVAENPDGSGQTACLTETKWDLHDDLWANGTVVANTISFVRVFDNATCAPEEEPVQPQYCDAINSVGVIFYNKTACETPGGFLEVTQPGTVSLQQFSGNIDSVYIHSDWSVLVSNGNQEACLVGTKWNLSTDKWEDGSAMGDISSAVVFNDTTCGYDEVPNVPEEPKAYCDNVSFTGVAFYDLKSCEQPGASLVVTNTGVVSLTKLSGHTSSVYIAPGWSIWVSNGSQEACLIGTKWDLSADKWPDGSSQDDNITRAKVFDNGTCQEEESPSEEPTHIYMPLIEGPTPKSFCNNHTFTGVGLFAAKSCELPGQAVTTQNEGELMFTFAPASIYVAQGFSVSVFGKGDKVTCITETKWDLTSDSWPGSDQRMTNIKSAVAYTNGNCGD